MTLDFIFVCALVLLAVGCAVLGFLIADQRLTLRGMAGQHALHERRFTNYAIKLGELQKQSPTQLAAEVGALAEAVQRLRATQQRFQGRFDQYVGQHEPAVQGNGAESDDPKWLALMRAQQAAANGGS
jgi:hypothetical protein